MTTRGSIPCEKQVLIEQFRVLSSQWCSFCSPENGFWDVPLSVAHLISPLPLQRKGFPPNFSRIHLDLWLYLFHGHWEESHCQSRLSSDALLSVVNDCENTDRCIWNEIYIPLCQVAGASKLSSFQVSAGYPMSGRRRSASGVWDLSSSHGSRSWLLEGYLLVQ